MSVEFKYINDDYEPHTVAIIHGPRGGVYEVSPFQSLECSITHHANRGRTGFGVTFNSENFNKKLLSTGTSGEAENFIRLVKTQLKDRNFWNQ
jgi:hypothetical protein